MGLTKLMQVSGLWDEPADTKTFVTVRAFWNRPWSGHSCTMDDIIIHSAHWDVDPVKMMAMAEATGEYVSM